MPRLFVYTTCHWILYCHGCSTCGLVFWLLGVESQDFSQAEKERTARKAVQIHKMTTILTSFFASSSFFLSMRKITWLNFQQPKIRGHVEDLSFEAKFSEGSRDFSITNQRSIQKQASIPGKRANLLNIPLPMTSLRDYSEVRSFK